MGELFVFQNCTLPEKAAVRGIWNDRSRKLKRLLDSFPPTSRTVRLDVRKSACGYGIKGTLELPTGDLVAAAEERSTRCAVDRVVDLLTRGVRVQKKSVRRRDNAPCRDA